MSFSIETIKEYSGRGFKCALFDFDGTLVDSMRFWFSRGLAESDDSVFLRGHRSSRHK